MPVIACALAKGLFIRFLFVIRIMFTMRKTNRLIYDFKLQTKDSIVKHMNLLAAMSYSVYSTRRKGLRPHLTDCDIYFYADAATVVLVCLDCCGNNEEQTYRESEETEPIIYSSDHEPRVSMVWKLAETVRLMTKYLRDGNDAIKVFGILLTEATILNAEDLEDYWDGQDIMVLDGFKRLKQRGIGVNDDDDLEGKIIVDLIQQTLCSDAPVLHPEENEFEDMLSGLFLKGYEDVFGKKPSDSEEEAEDDEEEEGDDDEADEEEADENNLTSDVLTGDNDDDVGSIYIPDGEIEQNNNVRVEVEILRPIAHPREELDKLVGCADIKRRMDELAALTSYNKRMRELFPESKQHAVSLHSLFLGRPGTGKTTVCKIFGSLMRQAGALSKGHVVICDRGTFIGTLWGDEERAMRQVLEKAQGGVLMIDEAYLLNTKHENDPGKMVIQLLMNTLADETQRDIAIVLCGYKEPMKKMLDINPGLASRFPNQFEFQDFTVEELTEITRRRVKDYDYVFTDQAWEKYCHLLNQAYQVRDPQTWGNARFVANLLERIYIQHAERCVSQQPADKLSWRTITQEDIAPIEIPRPKAKMGFLR